MAVQISRNISDGLNAKMLAEWGTEAAWWQWVKDRTRDHLVNSELRAAAAASEAALEAERARILGSTGTL